MPGNNNTNSFVGDGSVGIDSGLSSTAAKQIQQQISMANLNANIGTNSGIDQVYQQTLKMVQRWLPGDKIRIIQEFGNYANVTAANLDEETAKVIVANIDKTDLKRLIGSENAKSKELFKTVNSINATNSIKAKRYFTATQFKTTYNNIANYATTEKQIAKAAKQGFGVKIDRAVKKDVLPKLRDTVRSVLSDYTKMDLIVSADNMGIVIGEDESSKSIIEKMANMVNLYASIILAKGKNQTQLSIPTDAMEEIENILSITSFAWLVGKESMSPTEIVARRKAARNAKRSIGARRQLINLEKARDKVGTKKKLFKKNEYVVKNKFSRKKYRDEADDRVKSLGLLDNLTPDEIRGLALKAGIPDALDLPLDTLKLMVNEKIGNESILFSKINKKMTKTKSNRKRQKYQNQLSNLQSNSIASSAITTGNASTQDYSSNIPVISFNNDGQITSEAIYKAVPVYVVGMSNEKLGFLQSRKESAKKQKKDKLMSSAEMNLLTTGSMSNEKDEEKRDAANAVLSEEFSKFKKEHSGEIEHNPLSKFSASLSGSLSLLNTVASATAAEVQGPQQQKAKRTLSDERRAKMAAGVQARAERLKADKDNNVTTLANHKAMFSVNAIKLMGNKTFENDVLAVYNINKSEDTLNELLKYNKNMDSTLASIGAVTSSLNVGFASLQSAVGTNAAAAGAAGMATIQGTIEAANNLSDTKHLATGGNVKFKTPRVSQLITGDSPTNRNNTELVSVDWANKTVGVKPIPKFASGGSTNNNNSSVQRLASGQRNQPMSVGIASGLVTYSKVLNDVSDDSTNSAVKVYAINTGIDEKKKFGDMELSLMDIVYGIYLSMPTIASSIETGNKLLASISANTANTNKNIKTLSKSSSSGSGFEFPSNLDGVLSGR